MPLTLKKDLVIEDADVAIALSNFGPFGNMVDWALRNGEDLSTGYWFMPEGKTLPDGPLHPIAALAFGMAGFVLACRNGHPHVWDANSQSIVPQRYYGNAMGQLGPYTIIGHVNPEVV